jgi:hypothetical protein
VDSRDVYRLTLRPVYRLFVFGVMAVMSLAGLWLVVSAARGSSEGPPVFVAVLWCGALAWNWNVLLRIPYEIRFESANAISFVALAGTSEVLATDIRSIKPYGAGGGLYVLRHNGGKIRVVPQFTGFHEVIARMKAANPRVEVVGI